MPREFPRSRRIEEQIQRILSDVIRTDVRDPRLDGVIITAVKVSRDLGVAWIYYSMFDASQTGNEIAAAFDKANGFFRRRLAAELTVRRVPELRFEFDETGSRGEALEKLIDEAVSGNSPDTSTGEALGKADDNA